jgi:hypothetical protein
MNYWVPVEVTGLHELVGNALVMEGETERAMPDGTWRREDETDE